MVPGSIIVGNGNTDRGLEASIWTQSGGIQSLMDILAQNGVNLNGWQLNVARGISDDGRVIVGGGTNPQGRSEAWVIIIPEPSTILLAAAAFVFLPTHHRKSVPQTN